jgi:hypothetical protein
MRYALSLLDEVVDSVDLYLCYIHDKLHTMFHCPAYDWFGVKQKYLGHQLFARVAISVR